MAEAVDDLDGMRYNLDIMYESDDEPVVVNNVEVGRVQRRRFRFRADEKFFRSCLAYGATAVAVGATVYFLKDKLSLLATPVAANSVIFEVVVPKKSAKKFEELVENGVIRDTLHNVFLDIRTNIKNALGEKCENDIEPKELKKLERIRISNVKLCNEDVVDKAVENLEMEQNFNKSTEPPPPPKNLRIKENLQSPSTSLLVFYERSEREAVDKYVVAAQNLDGATKEKPIEQETDEEYTLVRNLQPGQSYLIWVQSVRNGVRSTKALLRDPVRTAQYDPHPWRAWDATSSVADSGFGTGASVSGDPKALSEIGDQEESEAQPEDPDLWNSDLHMELRKILRVRFPDSKMKRLLFKCDELGIVEAKDLKFLNSKEITDELKGTIKPVEILKLMDYAKDQYTTLSGTSEEDTTITPTDTPVRNLEDALSRDFGILFRQPQHHLECELKNYLHHLYKDTRIPTSILDKLQLTKILSVKICDEEIFKEIGLVLGVPPPTPKNLTVKENPQSPSTSLVVFYEHAENTIVDEYIAAAQTLCGGEPPKEVETTEEYAVIQGLLPGQAYVVWVQAIRTGVRSEKALVRMPIRTAQFDPHPWRGLNPGLLAETDEIAGTSADESAARGEPEPPQWNSNLHRELKRILGLQFPDSKMRQLLIKCDELGVAGVNDLKYLGRKEITDDLNGTIKPVEILKLMDYARDKISE